MVVRRRIKQERRPVTGEHPVIAAAISVLKEVGGPLKVSEIFALAEERGLLPASSHNTIRGRFTAHTRTRKPLIAALPRRAGWVLSDAGKNGDGEAAGKVTSLRDRRIDVAWLRRKRSPDSLTKLVQTAPGAHLTVRSLLLRPLDHASLSWFLFALPFSVDLRTRLLNAKGIQGRTSVLNIEERRERAAAGKAARARSRRRKRRQAVA